LGTLSAPRKLKILIWDIETRYVVARLWRTGDQYVQHDQIITGQHVDIICIGYKWYGEKKVHCLTWDKNQNSAKMVEAFSKIVAQADLVVAHNGDKFDMKNLNTQRLLHGQTPISWPTSEDTLKQLRKLFALPSYKLDYVAKLLTGDGKKPMAFDDWVQIVENKSAKHLKKMVTYCKKDVKKLEEVYRKIEKFIPPKLNASIAVHDNRLGCPRCGHQTLQKHGFRTTLTGRFQRLFCPACGSNSQQKLKLPKPA